MYRTGQCQLDQHTVADTVELEILCYDQFNPAFSLFLPQFLGRLQTNKKFCVADLKLGEVANVGQRGHWASVFPGFVEFLVPVNWWIDPIILVHFLPLLSGCFLAFVSIHSWWQLKRLPLPAGLPFLGYVFLRRGGGVHIQEFPTDFPNYLWWETWLVSLSRNASKLFSMSWFQTSLVSKSRVWEMFLTAKWNKYNVGKIKDLQQLPALLSHCCRFGTRKSICQPPEAGAGC